MKLRICALLAFAALLLATVPHSASAIEAEDHDAFFLALGTANISVRDSDALLSGEALWGASASGCCLSYSWSLASAPCSTPTPLT